MRKPLIALLFLAACVPGAKDGPDAAQDYADYCSACHGATGRGDGIAAAGLSKKPADLTRLAARNGGAFPTTRVMAQIWGYAKAKGRGVMPDFAPMMTGDLVPYDGGDGIETPTPERLVALAEYLKTLQAE
ncbi:c-type cytochrome [Tabrizicola fusiformis]|uniref:c-type cytochrome n=1 Tax=Tabrizicola sp. SY72 TaxID=2741673 RepID=UPI001574A9D8|nr:c-type cytochrome [Tabrizicola sp. SY72]NTT86239.1 c-type cytochrome [Tabrizicola sp. SY72]